MVFKVVFARYETHKKVLMNMKEVNDAIADGAIIEDDDGNCLIQENGELVDNIDDLLPIRVVHFWNNQ